MYVFIYLIDFVDIIVDISLDRYAQFPNLEHPSCRQWPLGSDVKPGVVMLHSSMMKRRTGRLHARKGERKENTVLMRGVRVCVFL